MLHSANAQSQMTSLGLRKERRGSQSLYPKLVDAVVLGYDQGPHVHADVCPLNLPTCVAGAPGCRARGIQVFPDDLDLANVEIEEWAQGEGPCHPLLQENYACGC